MTSGSGGLKEFIMTEFKLLYIFTSYIKCTENDALSQRKSTT